MRSRCDFNPRCAIIVPPVPSAEEEGEGFESIRGLASPHWSASRRSSSLRVGSARHPGRDLAARFHGHELRGIHESDVVRPRDDRKRLRRRRRRSRRRESFCIRAILSPFYRSSQHVDNNARVRVRVYVPRKPSTRLSDGAAVRCTFRDATRRLSLVHVEEDHLCFRFFVHGTIDKVTQFLRVFRVLFIRSRLVKTLSNAPSNLPDIVSLSCIASHRRTWPNPLVDIDIESWTSREKRWIKLLIGSCIYDAHSPNGGTTYIISVVNDKQRVQTMHINREQ